jgi:hypothetical protein
VTTLFLTYALIFDHSPRKISPDPLVPLDPDVPLVPDEPLDPDVPLLPDEPLVPLEPFVNPVIEMVPP